MSRRPLEERESGRVAGERGEQLGGAESRVRVRARRGRVERIRPSIEDVHGHGDAEPEERAALGIAGADLGRPAAAVSTTVAEATIPELSLLDEAEVHPLVPPLPDGGDERTGCVVGAVAVLPPRLPEEGVLEDADVVGERVEMRERRWA